MNISVQRYVPRHRNPPATCDINFEYSIIIKTDNGYLRKEDLNQQEVDNLAVGFIEDTLLAPFNYYEVIDRLIEVGIINREMIAAWKEGNK